MSNSRPDDKKEPTDRDVHEAHKTQVSRNANMAKLQAGYLFPEIARRKGAHMLKYPDSQVISLGIGDTTEPIPVVITSAMAKMKIIPFLHGQSSYLIMSSIMEQTGIFLHIPSNI